MKNNKSRLHKSRTVSGLGFYSTKVDLVRVPVLQIIEIWGELTLVFLVTHAAPEHFGDTILFTTDDDILEAIFCSDETFDLDVESLCGLQCEEVLRRPSTADGEGEERPYTQAGLWAEDRVGLAQGGLGERWASREMSSPNSQQSRKNEDGSPLNFLCYCFDISHFSTSFLVPYVIFHPLIIFILFMFFHQSEQSVQILIKATSNPVCVNSVI